METKTHGRRHTSCVFDCPQDVAASFALNLPHRCQTRIYVNLCHVILCKYEIILSSISNAKEMDFTATSSSSSRVVWLISVSLILVSLYFGLQSSSTFPLVLSFGNFSQFLATNVTSKNESQLNNTPPIAELQKKLSSLERLEAGLVRVRAAIKQAQSKNQTFDDPEYVPTGSVYWNPIAFHRYYYKLLLLFKNF